MNGAISYLRLHCSPIVSLILFFLFSGAHWGEIEERERQERGEIKNYWKIIKKHYLNEMVKKNRSFDIGCMVKWCVICYKYRFWKGKC